MKYIIPLLFGIIIFITSIVISEESVPETVSSIFQESCTRCHGDMVASEGLNLSQNKAFLTAVDRPSRQSPESQIIRRRDLKNSYLLQKIRHDRNIKGKPMPFGEEKLTPHKIRSISSWVAFLPTEEKQPRFTFGLRRLWLGIRGKPDAQEK